MTYFYTDFCLLGNDILVRGYKDGKRFEFSEPVDWSVYTTKKLGNPSGFRTIKNEPLNIVPCLTREERKEVESCIPDSSQIFYQTPEYAEIHRLFPGDRGVKFDYTLIRTLFLDIETETEAGFPIITEGNERINLITLRMNDKIITLGLNELTKKIDSVPNLVYLAFKDEKEMLDKFITIFRALDPDIVTGWNSKYFDMIYIANRMRTLTGSDKMFARLSPHGKCYRSKGFTKVGTEVEKINLMGVASVDYMDAYGKFIMKMQESMSLDFIASKELGDKKVSWKDKFATFRDFYTNDWDMFVEYNVHDVNLVYNLDQKKKYMLLICHIAYRAKSNIEDVFGQVKMWEQLIYMHLETNKKMIPHKKVSSSRTRIEGAYVKTPRSGLYGWLASIDAESMYPNNDIQWNISPDTIVDESFGHFDIEKFVREGDLPEVREYLNAHPNHTVAANGSIYENDRVGFIPEIMKSLFDERKMYKKQMNDLKRERAALKEQLKGMTK